MQNRRSDFARQVNERSLGFLGDPERWGTSLNVQVPVTLRRVGIDRSGVVQTPQMIRAQVESLAAVPWQLVASAITTAPVLEEPNEARILVFVSIDAGAGQAMHRLTWDVRESAGSTRGGPDVIFPAIEFPWQLGYAAHLYTPLPAASLNCRMLLALNTSNENDVGKVVPVNATLTTCPVAIPGWNL